MVTKSNTDTNSFHTFIFNEKWKCTHAKFSTNECELCIAKSELEYFFTPKVKKKKYLQNTVDNGRKTSEYIVLHKCIHQNLSTEVYNVIIFKLLQTLCNLHSSLALSFLNLKVRSKSKMQIRVQKIWSAINFFHKKKKKRCCALQIMWHLKQSLHKYLSLVFLLAKKEKEKKVDLLLLAGWYGWNNQDELRGGRGERGAKKSDPFNEPSNSLQQQG